MIDSVLVAGILSLVSLASTAISSTQIDKVY